MKSKLINDNDKSQTGPRCTLIGEWTDVHVERIQQWANRVINNIWNDPVRREQFLKKYAQQQVPPHQP